MSGETIKARFVGGPKHNEVLDVSRLTQFHVLKPVPIASLGGFHGECETYFLCQFASDRGARFWQYIHQSLMRGATPARETYVEDFEAVSRFVLQRPSHAQH